MFAKFFRYWKQSREQGTELSWRVIAKVLLLTAAFAIAAFGVASRSLNWYTSLPPRRNSGKWQTSPLVSTIVNPPPVSVYKIPVRRK